MAAVPAGDHESAPSSPQPRPTLYTSFLEVGDWCFSTPTPPPPSPPVLAGRRSAAGAPAEAEGRRGGVLTDADTKAASAASRLHFGFCQFHVEKSRYPKLALGRGWIRQGTKAVIGSLNMINPALIRKKSPSFVFICRWSDRTKSALANVGKELRVRVCLKPD